MQLIIDTLKYLSGFPSFYSGMGFMVAISMFVGAVLHNGNLPEARKGVIGTFSYFLILLWMGLDRLLTNLRNGTYYDESRVYAPTLTLVLVTICYVVGVFLGVWIVSFKKKK